MFSHPEFEKSPEVRDYNSILDFLSWERICQFQIEDNQVIIEEECDNCFRVNLTKEMMQCLIDELQELTNKLK